MIMKLFGNKLNKMTGTKIAGDVYIHYCPACDSKHGIAVKQSGGNVKHFFNNDGDKPTFTPDVKIDYMLDNEMNLDRHGLCHYTITDGIIQYHDDCTHDFAGKSITLPNISDHVSINMHQITP